MYKDYYSKQAERQNEVLRKLMYDLFGHYGNDDDLDCSAKKHNNTSQKDKTKKSESPLDYLQDNVLVLLTKGDQRMWCWYVQEHFIPIKEGTSKGENLHNWTINGIYKFPVSEINTLFWDGEPLDFNLDHPIWVRPDKNKQIDDEIRQLEARIAKLKESKVKNNL